MIMFFIFVVISGSKTMEMSIDNGATVRCDKSGVLFSKAPLALQKPSDLGVQFFTQFDYWER